MWCCVRSSTTSPKEAMGDSDVNTSAGSACTVGGIVVPRRVPPRVGTIPEALGGGGGEFGA